MLCSILVGGLLIVSTQCKQIEITIPPVELAVETPAYDLRNKDDLKKFAKIKVAEAFGDSQWEAFDKVIENESGWEVGIKNKVTGKACGLAQALPCSKLGDAYGDPEGELQWAIEYCKDRYHTPKEAWAHWQVKRWW